MRPANRKDEHGCCRLLALISLEEISHYINIIVKNVCENGNVRRLSLGHLAELRPINRIDILLKDKRF